MDFSCELYGAYGQRGREPLIGLVDPFSQMKHKLIMIVSSNLCEKEDSDDING